MMMRPLLLLLLLCVPGFADTSGGQGGFVESRWHKGDWVASTNDPFIFEKTDGDVVSLQIKGGGEGVLLRREIFPLRAPVQVVYRIRWSEAQYGNAYPSVNIVFDPPPLKDDWWKKPVGEPAGGACWSGGVVGFVFHYATDPGWRRAGLSDNIESGPERHAYSSPRGKWVELRVALDTTKVTVTADGVKVVESPADLSKFKTFAVAFGDQTSTRVELDALRIERKLK
jgi:hypothetical protein